MHRHYQVATVTAAVRAVHLDKGAVGIWVYQRPPTSEGTWYCFYEKALQLIGDPGTALARVCLPRPVSGSQESARRRAQNL